MIVFDLRCTNDHVFEGWFASAAAFEEQRASGMIGCPVCECRRIVKAVTAAAVPAKGNRQRAETDELRARLGALARLQAEVESRCDDVGARFAVEARRLHALPPSAQGAGRGIIGEATPDEARALIDDGIPIAPLPFRRRRRADA